MNDVLENEEEPVPAYAGANGTRPNGATENTSMKKRVTVSEAHIRLGRKNHCRECPVAIALGGHVKPNVVVSIGQAFGFWINGYEHGRLIEGAMPKKVLDWVYEYDNYNHSEPITFEVEIPDEAAA